MANAVVENSITVDGIECVTRATVTADGPARKEATMAAAKTGTLTTRTDDDTGELTMSASHGITTGARLDVYWDGGARYGMTVGTVSVNQVPIDGGGGDNLPVDETAITACVPQEEELIFTGNNAQFAFAKATRRGIVIFATAANAAIVAVVDEMEGTSGGGYQWYTGNRITNPFAASSMTKVFFSNGDSSNSNSMVAGVGLN